MRYYLKILIYFFISYLTLLVLNKFNLNIYEKYIFFGILFIIEFIFINFIKKICKCLRLIFDSKK